MPTLQDKCPSAQACSAVPKTDSPPGLKHAALSLAQTGSACKLARGQISLWYEATDGICNQSSNKQIVSVVEDCLSTERTFRGYR